MESGANTKTDNNNKNKKNKKKKKKRTEKEEHLDKKQILVNRCFELQQALLELSGKMEQHESRQRAAREEISALETYVDGLMVKMSAVKAPGTSPSTKLKPLNHIE